MFNEIEKVKLAAFNAELEKEALVGMGTLMALLKGLGYAGAAVGGIGAAGLAGYGGATAYNKAKDFVTSQTKGKPGFMDRIRNAGSSALDALMGRVAKPKAGDLSGPEGRNFIIQHYRDMAASDPTFRNSPKAYAHRKALEAFDDPKALEALKKEIAFKGNTNSAKGYENLVDAIHGHNVANRNQEVGKLYTEGLGQQIKIDHMTGQPTMTAPKASQALQFMNQIGVSPSKLTGSDLLDMAKARPLMAAGIVGTGLAAGKGVVDTLEGSDKEKKRKGAASLVSIGG